MEKKSHWQRFKEWWTIDHVVDLCVDALLLIWEVVSSPILIVVRIIRHFIGDWFVGGLKSIIKKIVHWFAHKREYRKAHGHGILRTYWWLILLSPIILFFLFIFLAMITGIAQDLPEMLELLLRGCQPGSEYWCNIS
jgi:Sec-independent protein secretion pathway component TatC